MTPDDEVVAEWVALLRRGAGGGGDTAGAAEAMADFCQLHDVAPTFHLCGSGGSDMVSFLGIGLVPVAFTNPRTGGPVWVPGFEVAALVLLSVEDLESACAPDERAMVAGRLVITAQGAMHAVARSASPWAPYARHRLRLAAQAHEAGDRAAHDAALHDPPHAGDYSTGPDRPA